MNDFLSAEALTTFVGATAIVVLFVNGFRLFSAGRWPATAPFVAFVVALSIVFACQGLPRSASAGLLSVANALALTFAAIGANQTVTATLPQRTATRGTPRQRFFEAWL